MIEAKIADAQQRLDQTRDATGREAEAKTLVVAVNAAARDLGQFGEKLVTALETLVARLPAVNPDFVPRFRAIHDVPLAATELAEQGRAHAKWNIEWRRRNPLSGTTV